MGGAAWCQASPTTLQQTPSEWVQALGKASSRSGSRSTRKVQREVNHHSATVNTLTRKHANMQASRPGTPLLTRR